MITIKEIAQLAGVSRGTVDRVINGRGGVKAGVAQRIHRIIAEHGFKPNKAARTLACHRKSYLVGVISPSIDNMFFKGVLRGIRAAEAEVNELGVSLMYREILRFSVRDQLNNLREMLDSGIDALAINPINDPAVIEGLRELNRRNIPVITFNSDVSGVDRLAYIGCDYHRSGCIAAGLLGMVCRGEARVAIVVGSLKSLGHCQRVNGFHEAAAAEYPGIETVMVVETFDDEITSYSRIREKLAGGAGVDAFFFAAGGKEGGIRAIRESALRDRVKIVTVDLDPLTIDWLRGGVVSATICQQPFLQGYEAVKQLAQFILYGERPAELIQYTRSEIVIPQSLVPDADQDRKLPAFSPQYV